MKKQLILIFVSILLMTTVFMTNQVKGASGDITLVDWDSVATHTSTGFVDDIYLYRASGTGEVIDTKFISSANKCLYIPATSVMWVNLTTVYSYISSVCFNFCYRTTSGTGYPRIAIYNGTTELLRFQGQTTTNLLYYWNGADYLTTGIALVDGATNYFKFFVNHTGVSNDFNISVFLNDVFVDYFLMSTLVAQDYTTFTKIKLFGDGLDNLFYIDDIIINTETTSGGGYGDFGGITPICSGGLGTYTTVGYTETTGGTVIPWYPSPIVIGGSSTTYPSKYIEHEFPYTWSGTIYGVDLPVGMDQLTDVSNDTNDYWLTINGIPSFGHPDYILPTTGGEYVLRWIYEAGITLTHEKPLFAFYCDEHTIGLSKDWYWFNVGITYSPIGDSLTHNNNIWYADNFFNGYVPDSGDISMCYYVTTDTTKQGESGLSDIELVNFTGLYGYTFIEFYENTFMCYHGIGSNPHIMYYLNDTYLEADSPFYRYQIMQVGTNIAVYDGLISMTGAHKDAKLRIMDYEFTQKGQYYIVLYNTTDYGTVLGTELYYSQVITVCGVGLGDPVTDTDTGGTVGLDFRGIPVFFKVIIALLIIVVLTICPHFFIVMIGRGTDNHIELPALVYVAFFFIGIVASIMLGFLEIWVFFIVLVGLIITFAILWLKGQDIGGGE